MSLEALFSTDINEFDFSNITPEMEVYQLLFNKDFILMSLEKYSKEMLRFYNSFFDLDITQRTKNQPCQEAVFLHEGFNKQINSLQTQVFLLNIGLVELLNLMGNVKNSQAGLGREPIACILNNILLIEDKSLQNQLLFQLQMVSKITGPDFFSNLENKIYKNINSLSGLKSFLNININCGHEQFYRNRLISIINNIQSNDVDFLKEILIKETPSEALNYLSNCGLLAKQDEKITLLDYYYENSIPVDVANLSDDFLDMFFWSRILPKSSIKQDVNFIIQCLNNSSVCGLGEYIRETKDYSLINTLYEKGFDFSQELNTRDMQFRIFDIVEESDNVARKVLPKILQSIYEPTNIFNLFNSFGEEIYDDLNDFTRQNSYLKLIIKPLMKSFNNLPENQKTEYMNYLIKNHKPSLVSATFILNHQFKEKLANELPREVKSFEIMKSLIIQGVKLNKEKESEWLKFCIDNSNNINCLVLSNLLLLNDKNIELFNQLSQKDDGVSRDFNPRNIEYNQEKEQITHA